MAMMEKTTIYIPAELRRALKEASRREKRPQAELIRKAVEEYLSKSRRPVPRSIGMGEDVGLDAKDSEDWLHERWRERP